MTDDIAFGGDSTPLDPRAPQKLDLTILSGHPTPGELAAVSATIAAMVDEITDDAALDHGAGQSAWQRSQRPLRSPLTPGAGVWRAFSG